MSFDWLFCFEDNICRPIKGTQWKPFGLSGQFKYGGKIFSPEPCVPFAARFHKTSHNKGFDQWKIIFGNALWKKDVVQFQLFPYAMANILRADGSNGMGIKRWYVNYFIVRKIMFANSHLLNGLVFSAFLNNASGCFLGMAFNFRIRTEQRTLSSNQAFDAVCKFLILVFWDIDWSQVEYKSLSGSFIGADIFNQMKVPELFWGAFVFFTTFLIYMVEILSKRPMSVNMNISMGHYNCFLKSGYYYFSWLRHNDIQKPVKITSTRKDLTNLG